MLIVNNEAGQRNIIKRAVPVLAGLVLMAVFTRLGFWQLDRAAQKVAMLQAFEKPARSVQVSARLEPAGFQAIRARGRYLVDKQFLIDNVVLNGRLGYFVISPLRYASGEPLLLVNRGWIEKGSAVPDITILKTSGLVRGKAGHLPRVGFRPGPAFAQHTEWPRVGVWPTVAETAAELEQDVLPYVLLLDPEQEGGYLRSWNAQLAGPSMHYGYAFQWFVMAIAILAVLAWNVRKHFRIRAR